MEGLINRSLRAALCKMGEQQGLSRGKAGWMDGLESAVFIKEKLACCPDEYLIWTGCDWAHAPPTGNG